MMALADIALYAAVLASIGPVALAVSTSLAFNFLRRPAPDALVAEARLLKLGQRLAVGEVNLLSQGVLVCHATGTCSIPPRADPGADPRPGDAPARAALSPGGGAG